MSSKGKQILIVIPIMAFFLLLAMRGTVSHGQTSCNNPSNNGWRTTIGGYGRDYATSIQQTVDGGYILTGATSSFFSKTRVFLLA